MQLPDIRREEVAVLISGTAVMGLEILAGRILAPAFGSSVYTWGSIIGVFMAALGLGYHVGGKRASSRADRDAVGRALLYAAVYVAFVLVAADAVTALARTLPLGPRYAAILPVVVLFGPPVYVLGFITPYVAELARAVSTGAASGRVFAVGTVGSIIGAFATTFLIIPLMSVAQAELLFGALLLGGALLVVPRRRVLAGGVLVVLLAAFAAGTGTVSVAGETVHRTQTPYQELVVQDDDGVRTLYLDGQKHSAMELDGSGEHVFRYTRYFHLPFLIADDPDSIDRVLFVGGGGFTGPKRFLRDYDVTVDVVELDPEVVGAAERYFNVSESDRLSIHVMDGRRFLEESDTTYDLIVLDAYRKDTVPFHLTTVEFMRTARDRLSREGVLLANLISAPRGPSSRFYRAEYRTMAEVFSTVYSFRTSDRSLVQNIELVATRDDRLDASELLRRNRERDIGIDLSGAIALADDRPPTDDVPLLRDGRAPVDSLLDPLLGTRYVIE